MLNQGFWWPKQGKHIQLKIQGHMNNHLYDAKIKFY